ncbi:migration and invasion-inhibitory protein-like isoform X2 [Dysidea avara]|uniref:migration and invasion-inhibitory protein-like isoform X2 n=1 Tax=Dysidea avara TaxID=196820 RepID=UPI00332AE438
MAAGSSDTNELMRMLNEGQEELKRSMRNLSTLTGPANDKKALHKLHPTPYRLTRKRARTQQLTPDLSVNFVSPVEQATPPRKRPLRRHSSTPKVKSSVPEPHNTPKNKPFKDASLEEAIFSSHQTKQKKALKDSNKLHKPSLTKSPKRQLSEVLNTSHYGALEQTLPMTRSLRKSLKYEGIDPKLGYDWIAGLLDTSSYVSQCSDEYFDDLKEFRRANREECSRTTSLIGIPDVSESDISSSPTIKVNDLQQDVVHSGVPSYILNSRLFPVPIHTQEEVGSHCPVCEQKDHHDEMPAGYIRVSVPRSTTQMVYRFRHHRRKSFDPDDSMSLSKHCLVGWENAKPSSIPTPASLHLKSSLVDNAANSPRKLSNYLVNSTHSTQYKLRSRTK